MSKIEKKQSLTVLEKFGAFSVLCASVYLIAISVFPVMYNLTGEFERNDFIFNAILLLIGAGSLFGSIRFIKKSILFEQLLDLGFEKGIYARLEPIQKFVCRRARQLSMVFFTASAALFLLVVLTVASMIGQWQSPIPISLDQLMLLGLHVFIFFSVGRKLRRKSVAASRPVVSQKSS